MAGYLTTHVLDTALGRPARGLAIELFRLRGSERQSLAKMVTNHDGRTDSPILPENVFEPGDYELVFQAGAYLAGINGLDNGIGFLNEIPIRFSMTEESHYHVPLLLSPFSYSTYRGS